MITALAVLVLLAFQRMLETLDKLYGEVAKENPEREPCAATTEVEMKRGS